MPIYEFRDAFGLVLALYSIIFKLTELSVFSYIYLLEILPPYTKRYKKEKTKNLDSIEKVLIESQNVYKLLNQRGRVI